MLRRVAARALRRTGVRWRHRASRAAGGQSVDLRSDTVTVPSAEMREAMAAADVGDDVFGEDATVNKLEEVAAGMLGKEAAVLVPTGTMGNLCCVGAHCGRGDEMVLGADSHIFLHEAGSPAALLGVTPRPVANAADGSLPLSAVRAAVREEDVHHPNSALVCLETTQNVCDGQPLSLDYLASARQLCDEHGLALHLDGARLFNAAVGLGVDVSLITQHVDTVSFCLSKGLGAPVGSVVAGSAAHMARVRRLRKAMGGGMRQAGVLAAAGLHALAHNVDRLAEDHRRARQLVDALAQLKGVHVRTDGVRTNIVWFTLADAATRGRSAEQITSELSQRGVLVSGARALRAASVSRTHPPSPPRPCRTGGCAPGSESQLLFRVVTHLDVDDEGVDRAVAALRAVLA